MTPRDWPQDRLAPVLASVASCGWRGEVLPPSAQPACGCAELTRCRRGRGRLVPDVAWGVTLDECLECVAEGGHV